MEVMDFESDNPGDGAKTVFGVFYPSTMYIHVMTHVYLENFIIFIT